MWGNTIMDKEIKVSVIIPTYGHPDYLAKAIESVRKQTMSEWELIIVDDNNPGTVHRQETEKVASCFTNRDERIKYIKHDRNRNGAVARNTGFAVARGEYIALLDSDDEYTPNRLEHCYNKIVAAPNTFAGVYTGCEFRKKGKTFKIIESVQSGCFLKETLACHFQFCTGSNIFVRKCVVDELGGFDPAFLRHQDYEFLVRLFRKYSLLGLSEVLVIKNNENFNRPDVQKLISIKNQYLSKYKNIVDSLSKVDRDTIYFWNYIAIAEAAMAQNDFKLANKYYREASNYRKITKKLWIRRITFPIYNLIK